MGIHIILSAPGNEICFYNEYLSLEAAIKAIKDYFGLYAIQMKVKYGNDENQVPCAFVNVWNRFFVIRNKESYESTRKERLTWTGEQEFRHKVMEKFKTRRFVKCYRICCSWQGDLIDKTHEVVSDIAHSPGMTYGAIETLEDAKIILAGLAAKMYLNCDDIKREDMREGLIGYVADSVTAQMDALIDGCCTMPNWVTYKIIETFVLEPCSEDEWNDERRFPLLYNSQHWDEHGKRVAKDMAMQTARYKAMITKLDQEIQD